MEFVLVVQFPARGSTQVLLCLFPGVLWLWHFLYSVGPYAVSILHIFTFVVSRAFMAGAASQAGDADSSRAPGLTSGLQGSVNVHRGALLLVPQWQCVSSFVFYIDWSRLRVHILQILSVYFPCLNFQSRSEVRTINVLPQTHPFVLCALTVICQGSSDSSWPYINIFNIYL